MAGEKPRLLPTAGNQEVTAGNQECPFPFLSNLETVRAKGAGPSSFPCPGNMVCCIPRTNKQAPQGKRKALR